MDLGPYHPALAFSDRQRILIEELRRHGPTREILRRPTLLSLHQPRSLDSAEQISPVFGIRCNNLKVRGHGGNYEEED